MHRIGIIGLGNIAQKAYLPVIAARHEEVHLCSRSDQKLSEIGDQYRFAHRHKDVASLIEAGITAAFVHTSTASHETIVEQLLNNNIHVYVDKPITYRASSSERLIRLASSKKLLLHVGFNRRFAPAYVQLKKAEGINMIIVQKNRKNLPGETRTFIFDDFIHVLDTLLFLYPEKQYELTVAAKKADNRLYHLVVTLHGASGCTAVGIMNRDSGTVEESAEVYTSSKKMKVLNLVETVQSSESGQIISAPNDWEPTLKKRGFTDIIDHFLKSIDNDGQKFHPGDFLSTHLLAEKIVERIDQASSIRLR